jgi:hypothetical protein
LSPRQENLFKCIIKAAIPIAVWTSAVDDVDVKILENEFSQLLNGSLTEFAELALRWRKRRMASIPSKHIKILCDHPDRVPRLPSCEDTDAIVA